MYIYIYIYIIKGISCSLQAPARAAPGCGQGDEGAHRLRPEDGQAHRRMYEYTHVLQTHTFYSTSISDSRYLFKAI